MDSAIFLKETVKNLRRGSWSAFGNLSYYRKWRKSLQAGNDSISNELPWINFPAIDFLKKYLKHGMKVFEYGGGGSTLFFLSNGCSVSTVEHSPEWFHNIESIIKNKYPGLWDGNLIVSEKNTRSGSLDISNPDDYASDDAAFSKDTFKAYASNIGRFPDTTFDVVLVDGRARPSCMGHAISKVKYGGLLILDNSERKYYLGDEGLRELLQQQFIVVQNKNAPLPFTRHFTTTTIWQKKR
jgi:hypothetical protein